MYCVVEYDVYTHNFLRVGILYLKFEIHTRFTKFYGVMFVARLPDL